MPLAMLSAAEKYAIGDRNSDPRWPKNRDLVEKRGWPKIMLLLLLMIFNSD